MTDPSTPRARRGRRVLVVVVALVALVLLLVALAPTLVSMGVGQGAIRSAIASSVNGDVQFAGLRAGWFGPQRVDGLRIVDSSGKEAANLNVQVDNGLLALALGRAKPMQITLSGSVAGQVREDGSLSFADLVKSEPRDPARSRTPRPRASGESAIPAIIVNVDTLDVTLESVRHQQTLALDDLKGTIAHADASQPVTIDLRGKTIADGTAGSLEITGQADGLFAADGSITLRGASTKLDINAAQLPLPLLDRPTIAERASIAVRSDDLTERIALTVDAEARIEGATQPASLKVDGAVGKLLTGDGALSFRAATANLTASITNFPVSTSDVRGEMTSLAATIASDDLTQNLDVAVRGSGRIASVVDGAAGAAQESTLAANLSFAEPFTPEGALKIAPQRITGEARADNLPTALAHPALAGIGVDAARDLGPTIDLSAKFPGGAGGDLTLTAVSPKASGEVIARINADKSITGSRLALAVPGADPLLLAALTGNRVHSDEPLGVTMDLTSFTLPAPEGRDDAARRPMAKLAATGTLTITGPASVRPIATSDPLATAPAATEPADQPHLPLERIELAIDSPGLGQYLALNGTALLGGGQILIDERITGLIDSSGALATASARPVGTLAVKNLPPDTIIAFAPPEHADVLREALAGGLNADITTSSTDAGLNAAVQARSGALTLNTTAVRADSGAITLDQTHLDLQVSPALLAGLQHGAANPAALARSASLTLDLEPFTLAVAAEGGSEKPAPLFATPLKGRVALRDAVIERTPTLAEALAVPALSAGFSIADTASERTITLADGTATLQRAAGKGDIAALNFAGSITLPASGDSTVAAARPDVNVRIAGLNTRHAEALLGQPPGTIANWTGDTGSLDARVRTEANGVVAVLSPDMPNLQGVFTASMKDDLVTLTAETSRLVLGKEALQSKLNPVATDPDAQPVAPAVVVEDDVPLRMTIERCEFPFEVLAGAPFDPARVHLDIALAGGPLSMANADGGASTLDNLDLSLRCDDASRGIQFALKGETSALVPPPPPAPAPTRTSTPAQPARAEEERPQDGMTPEERREARRQERRETRSATPPDAEPPVSPPAASQPQVLTGSLDVTGSLLDLVTADGRLAPAGSRLQMTAKVQHVPTVIADALADMQGLLVAAVGPEMNATFVADNFSANDGTLDARIDTTNGHVQALVRGREQSLRINRNGPLQGELQITPALRERLLMRIHPILADIRTTEQPLRFTIPTALAAIPTDISRLRAEIEVTVGKVELDSGSTTLKILSLFGRGDRAVIPGEIEPIMAQIRNGIVTYDKFSVHIDKYTLNYSGQINLMTRMVDLKTEIPLAALQQEIPELRDYAAHISVPLVTRGPFSNLKTTIDPDFDLGKAALDAGFKGTLSEFLKGGEGLFKDLFDKPKE